MPAITQDKALELLRGSKSTFISYETETDADVFNKGGKSGIPAMVDAIGIDPTRICKHTTAVGLVGTAVDYQTLVENRLAKESDLKGVETPDFTASPRKWGTRVDGVLVEHVKEGIAKRYVTVHCVANNVPTVYYSYNGKELDITDAKFDQWRKKSSGDSKKQVDAGIERPVIYRDYDLDSFVAITVGGTRYNITK